MLERKENVRRAVHFRDPEYIPLMYYGTARAQKTDMLMLPVEEMMGGEKGLRCEWGFEWGEMRVEFKLGIVKNPVIDDWSKLETYRPLDAGRPGRFAETDKWMALYPDRYFIADFVLSGFAIMSALRGFEDIMVDFYEEPEMVERLADVVFGAEEDLMRACAAKGFDAICLADDWGTQNSLMISHELWRRVFKPRYKKQVELAHSLGLDVVFHCCGYIMDILPDLIEIGIDVINPGQPVLNGIAEMGRRFAGRICFGCPIGYQTTAINGTPEDIDREIAEYVRCLNTEHGGLMGFVASANGLAQLGAPPENQQAVQDCFEKYCGRR